MEVRQTRHAEIKLIKIDTPEANIRYTGWSNSMRAADGDLVWQILREVKTSGVVTSTYAEMGSFKCSWTARATYFTAATPEPSNPLDGEVTVTGSLTVSGPSTSGVVTEVTLNATTWTALPTTMLTGRLALLLQNFSGQRMKLNYDNAAVGFVGAILEDEQAKIYNMQNIILYGKCESGTATIICEELS